MDQQSASLTRMHASLLVLLLFLAVAIAFLAITNVQVTVPLPYEKTAPAFFAGSNLP